MGYYLEDHPNTTTAQYGWPRKRVSGVIGVHTAENNTDLEGADPGAEDVAGFISRRTDYGSYHVIADADSIVRLVRPGFAAWADMTNNAHALSVSGAMQAARWADLTPERAEAITRNMARAAAQLVLQAVADGLLASPTPAVRISAQEAIAGSRAGFYGHGETNPGRRYDPGQNFNWTLFLAAYAGAIGGSITTQSTTTTEEDELSKEAEDDIKRIRQVVEAFESDRIRERVVALDDRTATLVQDIRYVKGTDSPDLLERMENGTYRVITMAEWETTGKPYAVYPQAQIDALPKA